MDTDEEYYSKGMTYDGVGIDGVPLHMQRAYVVQTRIAYESRRTALAACLTLNFDVFTLSFRFQPEIKEYIAILRFL